MEVDDDKVIDALGSALRYGGAALGDVPDLLKRVLRTQVWREFTTQRREPVRHKRFIDFVTTQPLAGLGSDVDLIRRIVGGDPEALDLLDQALQNPVGTNLPLSNIQGQAPTGTTRDRALRKLRKDAPELHAAVLAGDLTAHGAMVKAGFRLRTLTVRPEPAAAARTLRKHLTPEQCAELARLLTAEVAA
jgi:hypothetical protein